MNAVLQLAPAPPSAALRIGVEEHLLSLALTGIPELTQGIPANLRVEDFASGWTRAVFEKVLSLREAGEPITCDFVADALRSDNRLAAVVFGGSSGLEALRLLAGRANFLDGSVAKVARKVRELADSRRESDARERAGLRLANGDPIPDVFRALESEIGDRSRRANEGLTPSDLIAAMRAEGPLEHEPTGFPTLDRMTRGGLAVGRRHAIVGAPGAGKTFMASHIGATFLARGLVVGVLGVDEDPDDVFARYVTMLAPPYHIGDCEQRDEHVLDEIEAKLAPHGERLRFFDGTVTIEQAAARTASLARKLGVRACFIVDSVQTAQCDAVRADPRLPAIQVIDANVAAIRRVTTEHRLISLFTSEMNRGAYRSREAAENSVALAAAKGSSAIEYSAQLVIALRSLKDEPDVVEAEIAKNRGGEKGTFHLKLDRRYHALAEVEAPEAAAPGDDRTTSSFKAKTRVVLGIVAAHPGCGTRELRRHLTAGDHRIGNETLSSALTRLEAEGAIENRPEGRGHITHPHYYAIPKEVSHAE